jgi:large subunit ribosomal protein L24
MKKEFSTAWNSSKQPRKQRKYLANAPLHLKKKVLSVNLSKDLRVKYGRRNIQIRKGDVALIMRGKFKGKKGKVLEVKIKKPAVYIEGMQVKKKDGSKTNVRLQASNLQIIELNLEDKKRKLNKKEESSKNKKKETTKKEDIKENKEKKK